MKSLDEIIKAFIQCISYNKNMCYGCPYADDIGKPLCCGDDKEDALHYLMLYKNTDENYNQAIAYVTKVIDHYEKMVADYLSVNNPALSWEELKQMEGEPVWIEGETHKHWCIIEKVFYDDLLKKNFISLIFRNHKGRLDKYQRKETNMGKRWNAYKRKRDDSIR